MHHDFTEALASGALTKPPRHRNRAILTELRTPGLACKAQAPPVPFFPGPQPAERRYLCSRSPGHDMPHVAGIDMRSGRYVAEWDNDRTTDKDA